MNAEWPVVALTGHRPARIGGNAEWVKGQLARVLVKLRDEFATTTVISGCALGTDTWGAQAALDAGMDLWTYVPFEAQADRWPSSARQTWRDLRAAAAKDVLIGGKSYDVRQLFARNHAMLRDCDALVAVFDRTVTTGGTFDTLRSCTVPAVVIDPMARTVKLRQADA